MTGSASAADPAAAADVGADGRIDRVNAEFPRAIKPCLVCDSSDRTPIQLREMLFGSREAFGYLLCGRCGAMAIESVPPDLGRHYPASYFPAASAHPAPPRLGLLPRIAERAENERLLFGRRPSVARRLRRWRPETPLEVRQELPFVRRTGLRSFADPILDVGSGPAPERLERLRRIGFTALTGIDPYLDSDRIVNGIKLYRRDPEQMRGQFQLITLHHVFEHVADPEATLRAIVRLLRPTGVVVIRTPVMGTWFWETYGADWWELDPPRHLMIHSRRSLDLLFSRTGLELTDVVFDSTLVEIIASEQIRRDIAWREPASWLVSPPAGFEDIEIDRYREKVADLNRTQSAGRAAFFLRLASKASG